MGRGRGFESSHSAPVARVHADVALGRVRGVDCAPSEKSSRPAPMQRVAKTCPALRQRRARRQPAPPRQHRRSLVPRHRPQRLAPARPHPVSTPEPRQRVPTTRRSTSAGLSSALEMRAPQRAQPVSAKITPKSPSSKPSPSPLLQDVRGGRLQRPITAPGKRSQHEGSSRQELPRSSRPREDLGW